MIIDLKKIPEDQHIAIKTLILDNNNLKNIKNIALATFKDIDILIIDFKMCEKDSLFYNDFYKRFEAVFPDEYKKSRKMSKKM